MNKYLIKDTKNLIKFLAFKLDYDNIRISCALYILFINYYYSIKLYNTNNPKNKLPEYLFKPKFVISKSGFIYNGLSNIIYKNNRYKCYKGYNLFNLLPKNLDYIGKIEIMDLFEYVIENSSGIDIFTLNDFVLSKNNYKYALNSNHKYIPIKTLIRDWM